MTLFFEIILFLVVALTAYECGKTLGRIEVAGGEYVCILAPQKDKTTVWNCKKAY